MSDYTKYVEAVRNGAETSEEIAEALGLAHGHVQRVLKDAVEEGALARYRPGKEFVYQTHEAHGTDASKAPTDDGLMPATKTWSYGEDIPTEAVEYVPTDGELDKLRAYIRNRDRLQVGVRARLGGDTGSGKTTLAEYIGYDEQIPVLTIQGRYTMRESDLLGTPMMAADGSSQFVYGKLVKALDLSNEGPVILLIDEANRARAQALSVLFSVLDHRAEVTLEGPRGGEVIKGDSNNLIVIATVNEGPEFVTERTDAALNSRLALKFNIQYLGLNDPDAEARLLTNRTGIAEQIALDMVYVANDVRRKASKERSSPIRRGIPTRALLTWAETAQLLGESGFDNPIIEAALDSVVLPLYDDDDAAMDEVSEIIAAKFDGAPVDAEEYAIFNSDEEVVCGDCGWETPRAKADKEGHTATMNCPQCAGNGTLQFITYD